MYPIDEFEYEDAQELRGLARVTRDDDPEDTELEHDPVERLRGTRRMDDLPEDDLL